MPALQQQANAITLEQYEQLPEHVRAEVFDGYVYDMASPSVVHQRLSTQLLTIINTYLLQKKGTCEVFAAPFDVKLSDNPLTIVQPDLVIVCDPDKLTDGKRCNGAPDFIIEIVSPSNASHDYIQKLSYYKSYGVREYWIVDPQQKQVFVYCLEAEDFKVQTYTFHNNISVNIYDDLSIDFSQLSELVGL